MANHALEIREAKFLFTQNVVSRNLFYLFFIYTREERERLTRHMRNNEVLQNIYFFTTLLLFHVNIMLYPFFPFMVVKLQRIVFG